ncbi:MAG: hypothetical protein RJA07_721 [Bacteroidota bacterium]|jgi:AAA15 family ATPase/GTPase
MLIQFKVKNLFSFKEETAFNLFPNNKIQRLPHHKVNVSGIDVLRLSALYGANASGKSNLIKAMEIFKLMVENGEIDNTIEQKKFRLSNKNQGEPIEMSIEFFYEGIIFYYAISILNNQVIYEYLAESKKSTDELVFKREIENNIQTIQFDSEYLKEEENVLFASVLEGKILEKNSLLLSFLAKKYDKEFVLAKKAFDWFENILFILTPITKIEGLAHNFDTIQSLNTLANELIKSFNTGISRLKIETKNVEEFFDKSDFNSLKKEFALADKNPNSPVAIWHNETHEQISLVKENNQIVAKRIISEHKDESGNGVEFTLPQESDGTIRLIDYVPVLERLINSNLIFIIDEIERSIHPLLIKEIVSKFSLDEQAQGQLIFTTHESSLLDQDILRPDEIWFTEKDQQGSSKLYSLSDFKVHNTIDIENNYLKGRYGGIPFLGNLHDLNWHKYNDAKPE